MSDFIYTKIRMYGLEKEIMTPKHLPDAQERHNLAYLAAFNDLRAQEADRREAEGTWSREYHIDPLREPWKISRTVKANPFGHMIGSTYQNNLRLWRPAMPVEWWHAPKCPSPKAALTAARKIPGGDYRPKVTDYSAWGRSAIEPEQFNLISFEEVDDHDT